MNIQRFLLLSTLAVFGMIGVLAFFKEKKEEVAIESTDVMEEYVEPLEEVAVQPIEKEKRVDRIRQLFTTGSTKLPIVETVKYTSRVPWLKGRPAWITDYASHYGTSRHFIARSLNGKPDYFTQKVASGNKFNVFRADKKIEFYLVVDLSAAEMDFYYFDGDTNERVLLKTYTVGVGRRDDGSPSGSLTPLGRYKLGEKVAIYKPGVTGFFQEEQVEMIQVFGTRWIPFSEAVTSNCEDPDGFGIHGAPWYQRSEDGELVEDRESVSRRESDGCIRLLQEDIEELFSIVISKPTFVEVVMHKQEADLPGVPAEFATQ